MCTFAKTHCKKDLILLKNDDRTIFVKSQWQKKPLSLIYLIYRLLLTCYFIITIVLSVSGFDNPDGLSYGAKWWIYLTHWGYTTCMLQSVLTTSMLTRWYCAAKNDDDQQQQPPKLLLYNLYWGMNIVAIDFAYCISIMYWCFIHFQENKSLNIDTIIVHVLNSILMTIELFVTAHPMRILHVYVPICYGVVYCIFTVIYYVAGGTNIDDEPNIYNILDWRKPSETILVCLGFAALIVVIHCITYALYRLRIAIYKACTKSSEDDDKI